MYIYEYITIILMLKILIQFTKPSKVDGTQMISGLTTWCWLTN